NARRPAGRRPCQCRPPAQPHRWRASGDGRTAAPARAALPRLCRPGARRPAVAGRVGRRYPGDMANSPDLIYATVFVFLLGAVIGSLLNVCIARLPLEKSAIWPGSRCRHCLSRVRPWDTIPLVSYWLLGGRCRTCGHPFSFRYFVVEATIALLFVGLFWVEIGLNWQHVPYLDDHPFRLFGTRELPWRHAVMFLHHATLFSLLLAAAVCDMDRREIPLALTVPGTLVGLGMATLFPWPWPSTSAQAVP